MADDFSDEIRELKQTQNANQAELDELNKYKNEKDSIKKEMENLRRDLVDEQKKRKAESTLKEVEKQDAVEKLRKEMLKQIKKTKANLLALNDEQLAKTTRLTMLQNDQLANELEMQSRQTELIVARNDKLQDNIETLKRDIEIHKDVEKELAKRSHFCQKVIKRQKLQINNIEPQTNFGNRSKSVIGGKTNQNDLYDADKGSEELINFLESKLEKHEISLKKVQMEYDRLQSEHIQIQDKYYQCQQKYKRAGLLLTEFLEDMLNDNQSILATDSDLNLNVEHIKNTPFEQLKKEDKITLVLVLLKQLQPFLSSQNLNVAQIASQSIKNGTGSSFGSKQRQVQQSPSALIDKALNNINVESRNGGAGQMTTLPPINKR